MPNAKSITNPTLHKFLMAGPIGAGKTAGFLTLPGKKFAYLFDPNAVLTLQGHDVDYEEFLPDDVSLKLTSLSKDTQARQKNDRRPDPKAGAELYWQWEKDFEQKCDDGFFDSYDALLFDSSTTLLDMIMDGVLAINGRAGQWPNMDDYGPQMLAFTNIVRRAASLGKIIYFTAHTEMRQDDVSKRIQQEFMLTGKLRSKIPLLFSEVLIASNETEKQSGTARYFVQTRPDKEYRNVRCTLKDARFMEDVTVDWNKPAEGQGLGQLYFNQQK